MDSRQQTRSTITAGHVATGLLLLMAAVYVAARLYEPSLPALSFLRAFAEAAMVGALADWFAVTALFRRPLGLPIRHTAIIPRNKDRIGEALGNFVENNFLSPDLVASRLASVDLTSALTRWLADPDNAARASRRIVDCLPPLLGALHNEDVQRFIKDSVTSRLRRFEIAPLVGDILAMLTSEGRHRPLVDALLKKAIDLLKEHEPDIRDRVRDNTAWLWQKLAIDERVSDKIITVAEDTLREIGADPAHPWRLSFDRQVMAFAEELRTSAAYRAQGEEIKERLLQHPALNDYLSELWAEIRQGIIDDARSGASAIHGRLVELSRLVADGLERDAAIRKRLNHWLRGVIVAMVGTYRHEVANLIAGTVRKWDAQTMSEKIEERIGNDLQFIRINGTLIGGLVGLALYGISIIFF